MRLKMPLLLSAVGSMVFCAALLAAPRVKLPSARQDTSAKDDAKDAGKSTKNAAKKAGSATKKETKKGVNKSAQKTKEGANKVEDKTAPQ